MVLRREVMLSVQPGPLRSKLDLHRFESGRAGLTRQILRMGLQVLVVGCDGQAYEPDRWYESETYRRAGQRNLLIGDNRTRQFEDAAAGQQAVLARLAWGER